MRRSHTVADARGEGDGPREGFVNFVVRSVTFKKQHRASPYEAASDQRPDVQGIKSDHTGQTLTAAERTPRTAKAAPANPAAAGARAGGAAAAIGGRLVHKSAPTASRTRRSRPYSSAGPTTVIRVRPVTVLVMFSQVKRHALGNSPQPERYPTYDESIRRPARGCARNG